MSPRMRIMVGAITTAVFLTIGATLTQEERGIIGPALLALGALRGVVLARQVWFRMRPVEDDEEQ